MSLELISLCLENKGALKGQKVIGEISGRGYARESFVAGLNGGRLIAPLCYTGT